MPPLASMLVVPCTETRVLVDLAESMVLHVRIILVLSGVILCTAWLPFVSDAHLVQPLLHESERVYTLFISLEYSVLP